MTLSDEAVERVARIINPGSWAVMDGYLADMKRKYRGENIGYDPENFRHKESMAIARAALEASGLVDQSEQIKALEDRLATARDTICRSAYFVEALADNDPDEPIADNGMTVLGKLQYDAPALALSLRATLDAIKEKNGA